jgi:hypothetical protein
MNFHHDHSILFHNSFFSKVFRFSTKSNPQQMTKCYSHFHQYAVFCFGSAITPSASVANEGAHPSRFPGIFAIWWQVQGSVRSSGVSILCEKCSWISGLTTNAPVSSRWSVCSSVIDVFLLLAVRAHHRFGKIWDGLVCAPWKTGVRYAKMIFSKPRSRLSFTRPHYSFVEVDTTSGFPSRELIFSIAKLVR